MPTPLPQRVPQNAPGDFYVQAGCCTRCCMVHGEAPDLLNDPNEPFEECYFRRQPQTSAEVDQAINAIRVSEMCALRYGGHDPQIIRRVGNGQSDYPLDAKPQVSSRSEQPASVQYTLPPRHSLRRWSAMLLFVVIFGVTFNWWLHHHSMPWTAARALDNAEQYELFSLFPRLSEDEFHGHRILGHAPVTDPAMRKQLSEALKKAARESNGDQMACFEPRHGIRVTEHGQVTDFVICFQCLQVAVWRDGKQIAYFTISDSQAPIFNAAILRLNLPPAPIEP